MRVVRKVCVRQHAPMALLFAGFVCACRLPFFSVRSYSIASQVVVANTTIDNASQYFQVDSIDWSPNDESIALGTSLGIYVYSTNTGSFEHIKIWSGTSNQIYWDSSGDRLAGSERQLWLWDRSTGAFVFSPNNPDSYESFESMLLVPDGQSVIGNHYSITSGVRQILIWNLSTNELAPYTIPNLSNSTALAQSPDGALLAIADSNVVGIQIINFSGAGVIQSLTEARSPAAWSPNGRFLLTNSKDNALMLWDTSSWQPSQKWPGPEDTIWRSLKWKPTGNYAAIATDKGVWIWNLDSGDNSTVQAEAAYGLDWSSDGSRLATAIDNQLYIWNIDHLP